MKKQPDLATLLKEPGVQVYLFVSLVSLGLVLMVQMAKGNVLLNAIIFIIGILGIVARFSSAPAVLLLAVALGELFQQQYFVGRHGFAQGPWRFSVPDLIQSIGVIAYIVAQTRFLGLTSNLMPRDPRQREESPKQNPVPYHRRRRILQRRTPALFTPREVAFAMAGILFSAILAQFVWYWLSFPRHVFGLDELPSQLVLLAWVLFLGLVAATAVLGIWRWYALTREEALLYMQDTYWRETGREQRRQYRWLAWARAVGKYRRKK